MVFERISGGLASSSRISAVALVLANMVPIIGVILWDWSVFEIVALYWAENVVIGVLNVLKIVTFAPKQVGANLVKLFIVPFFCAHYGIFCAVHGFFVQSLVGSEKGASSGFGLPIIGLLEQVMSLTPWACVVLSVSHLFSFFWNYLGKKEFRKVDQLVHLMMAPYPRIVVLHIAILFGAFAIELVGAPLFLLLVLVVGKTILDLGFHLFEHGVKGPE